MITVRSAEVCKELQSISAVSVPPERVFLPEALGGQGQTVVSVPKCFVAFDARRADPNQDTHDKKSSMIGGLDKYAEYAVLRALQESGWQGRWIDNWKGPKFWKSLGELERTLPVGPAKVLFDEICSYNPGRNRGRSWGCWDIFAWRDDSMLFVECKRRKKDRLNDNQRGWLAAGLRMQQELRHLPPASFWIVEWQKRCPFCHNVIEDGLVDTCAQCKRDLPG